MLISLDEEMVLFPSQASEPGPATVLTQYDGVAEFPAWKKHEQFVYFDMGQQLGVGVIADLTEATLVWLDAGQGFHMADQFLVCGEGNITQTTLKQILLPLQGEEAHACGIFCNRFQADHLVAFYSGSRMVPVTWKKQYRLISQ